MKAYKNRKSDQLLCIWVKHRIFRSISYELNSNLSHSAAFTVASGEAIRFVFDQSLTNQGTLGDRKMKNLKLGST
jgi:hypothetical protein